jgi:hypothetical protein
MRKFNGILVVQIDIKEVENESIKGWTQSVTKTTNSCDHSLKQTENKFSSGRNEKETKEFNLLAQALACRHPRA